MEVILGLNRPDADTGIISKDDAEKIRKLIRTVVIKGTVVPYFILVLKDVEVPFVQISDGRWVTCGSKLAHDQFTDDVADAEQYESCDSPVGKIEIPN